ncbi:hypothetical protein ACJJTC_000862 [Scirpophaga incertulas]
MYARSKSSSHAVRILLFEVQGYQLYVPIVLPSPVPCAAGIPVWGLLLSEEFHTEEDHRYPSHLGADHSLEGCSHSEVFVNHGDKNTTVRCPLWAEFHRILRHAREHFRICLSRRVAFKSRSGIHNLRELQSEGNQEIDSPEKYAVSP